MILRKVKGEDTVAPYVLSISFDMLKHRSARHSKASIMSPFSPTIANKTTIKLMS